MLERWLQLNININIINKRYSSWGNDPAQQFHPKPIHEEQEDE